MLGSCTASQNRRYKITNQKIRSNNYKCSTEHRLHGFWNEAATVRANSSWTPKVCSIMLLKTCLPMVTEILYYMY